MTKQTTTTVSLYGDRTYAAAMKVVAAQNGVTVGKFIRKLIDEKYGDDIEKVIVSFFENNVPQKEQNKRKRNGAKS